MVALSTPDFDFLSLMDVA